MKSKQRIYCIFEGAGARGLGHVGAFRALSKQDVEFAGFAGTSAGAIIAALAACGYSAEELFSVRDGSNVLDRLDLDSGNSSVSLTKQPAGTPANLFGKAAWRKLQLIRMALRNRWIGVLILVIGLLFASTGVIFFPRFALGTLLVSIAALCLLARATIVGFVSLDAVKAALDQLIAMKCRGRRDGAPVTFRDLALAGFPPLKIVAANISQQELVVFSAETTPGVAVSEAVCASIGIPCVFKPRSIEGNWFMDGGLVSNLPAWTFDDERSIDRDALTAAIEIGVSANKDRKRGWTVGSMLGTMVFGAGVLNKRAVERLTAERLTVNIGLIDFDVGRKRASEIISETEVYCEGSLIARMIELPRIINDKCEDVSRRCHGLISASYAAAGLENFGYVTRIAIAIPVAPRYRTVRLEFSSGYTDLSDERITLPLERSLIGRAWNENETLFASKSDPAVWNESLAAPQDRWLRKLIWKDLNWVLCVPLKIDEQTRVIVTLDCDRELAFDHDTQQELLNALEDLILQEFQFLRNVERELLHGR